MGTADGKRRFEATLGVSRIAWGTAWALYTFEWRKTRSSSSFSLGARLCTPQWRGAGALACASAGPAHTQCYLLCRLKPADRLAHVACRMLHVVACCMLPVAWRLLHAVHVISRLGPADRLAGRREFRTPRLARHIIHRPRLGDRLKDVGQVAGVATLLGREFAYCIADLRQIKPSLR